MDYKIETKIEIKNKHDLNKLRKVKELTNLGKVNSNIKPHALHGGIE